jgi:hypothetical protein
MQVIHTKARIREWGSTIVAKELPDLERFDWQPVVYKWLKQHRGIQMRNGLLKVTDVRKALYEQRPVITSRPAEVSQSNPVAPAVSTLPFTPVPATCGSARRAC